MTAPEISVTETSPRRAPSRSRNTNITGAVEVEGNTNIAEPWVEGNVEVAGAVEVAGNVEIAGPSRWKAM